MPEQKVRPIIIIRKKVVKHSGSHGGAWKVAYADFVTAMMSLFIVLWLMNSNAKVKEAVAGYFKDPAGVGKLSGTNLEGKDKTVLDPGVPPPPSPEMAKLKTDLEKAIRNLPIFQAIKDHIVITITEEGVRMDLMETAKGLFFENGVPVPTKDGADVLHAVSTLVGKLPNRLMIEGHTDSVPYVGNGGYSNWQLSSARADSARVLMEQTGLHSGQVFQIRGFADQQLRLPAKPADPTNRRISLIILNLPGVAHPAEKSSVPPAAPRK